MIKAEIVAHSLSSQGDELISVLCTFPRIILAEVNTHRMLSKNTSSSRAIPFKKMVEAIQNDPFIPIAWQKEHKGMQGSEYITDEKDLVRIKEDWLEARDYAIYSANQLNNGFNVKDEEGKYVTTNPDLRVNRVTKQLCNRLLEPFMWTTMLITGSREGWDNFFHLRCSSYELNNTNQDYKFKSKKEAINYFGDEEGIDSLNQKYLKNLTDLEWLQINKGQAEIHIMDLAEKIYDAMNESTPKQLQAGEWHIPFRDKISSNVLDWSDDIKVQADLLGRDLSMYKVKVSVAMAARTSYTVVGDEKEIDYQKMIELHNRLLSQDPPHSSPLEHCARAMTDDEYRLFIKGKLEPILESKWEEYENGSGSYVEVENFKSSFEVEGWCNNLKGFIPYRYIIDNKKE